MLTKLELYQKVTPLAHLGIFERNLETGEIYWNEVMREIYEVGPDFDPTPDRIKLFYINQSAIVEFMEGAVNSGRPNICQFEIKTAKGNTKWLKIRVHAELTDGECECVYGTAEDITKQESLLSQLADEKEQFHQAFEFAPIGMALVSIEGKWIRVNRTLCHILGYSARELLRMKFSKLTYHEDLTTDQHFSAQLIDNLIPAYQIDKRYLHKDGTIIWASLNVTLVRGQSGEPRYYLAQIKNISDRKNLEIERIKALEIISAQNNRLLNFAHIVSHNLRSHASNIQMIAEMVGQDPDPAEQQNMMNMLTSSAANLQETLLHLNEVVDVHSKGTEDLKKLNLRKEIKKMTDIVSPSLKQAKGKITLDISPAIELEYVQAYLESIILNLLTNAIKYRSPDRLLEVTVSAIEMNKQVIMTVSDNGIGLDLARHGHKIFGMYKTFHGNNDARGIGLFLIKNQIEVMGGQISVDSNPGKGTTFRIEF